MSRSALATGKVDYELAPAEMATPLMAYAVHAFGKLSQIAHPDAPKSEHALKKIFVLLRVPRPGAISPSTNPVPSTGASNAAWRCTRLME